MSERGQRIRLGLFIFGALAAIGTLIVIFAKQPQWLMPSRADYNVVFDSVTGVQRGTPVRRSGVKIGEVDAIDLVEEGENAGKVLVKIRVDRKYVPRNSETAAITQALLTGDSVIDIVLDTAKKPLDTSPRPAGDTFRGRSPFSPREVGEQAKPLLDVTVETLTRIRDTLERFAKVAPEAENTLKEFAALSRSLRETVPELQKTNDSLRLLADQSRATIPDIKRTNSMAERALTNWSNAGERVNVLLQTNEQKIGKSLDDLSRALDEAKTTFEKANRVFSDENQKNLTEILENVRIASKDASQLMQDGSRAAKRINESADKFDTTMTNLQKASQPLADRGESIIKNVEDTTAQMQQFVKEIRTLTNYYVNRDGTIQRLLTDPSLFNNVNEASIRLSMLMPRLERILVNLEVFADKIAQHPEKLGVRGAIKPDSGLKFSPTAPSNAPR